MNNLEYTYNHSEAGRARTARYEQSEKGIAKRKRDKDLAYTTEAGRRGFARRTFRYLYPGYELEDKEAMFAAQGSKCGACGTADPGGKRQVWHFHHTGSRENGNVKAHAVLCARCNWAAGQGTIVDIERLELLVAKLREWL